MDQAGHMDRLRRSLLRLVLRPPERPVPTLSAARGIAPLWPKPRLPEPLPAQLLAHWPLDDGAFAAATASGDGFHAQPVNLAQTAGRQGSGAGRFDGESFIRAGGLGAHEAVSVALWVKAESLTSRWNPLLFTDGRGKSAFHFSVRDDGAPNVAINSDGKSWVHNGATGSIAAGQWCHVAVVCDSRPGGTIRFYIDGKPAGTKPLGLGLPLDLDAFRVGAWSGWEKQPGNNFHGCLDDVRIYRGVLTSAEVAALAEVPEPAAR